MGKASHSFDNLKHFKYFFLKQHYDFITNHSILLFFFLFHNFLDFDIHHKIILFAAVSHQVHVLSFIRFGLVSIKYFVGPIFLYFV